MFQEVVLEYLNLFPEDRPKLKLLLEQISNKEDLDDRRNFRGHICGDAIIFSPDFKKILLIHHKRFQRWQQPGGHLDKGEEGPWLTAVREAAEETGVSALKRVNIADDLRIPMHIATGFVPPSKEKQETEHYHHDFRYGFIAETEDLSEISDEGIDGVKWFVIDELKDEGAHTFGVSVERLKNFLSS